MEALQEYGSDSVDEDPVDTLQSCLRTELSPQPKRRKLGETASSTDT